MKLGGHLEQRFYRWMKELNILFFRFYDSRSMGRVGPERPADFWIWVKPTLIFVECKEVKVGKSLSFESIRPSQYKSAIKAPIYGYKYYLLVDICDELYTINMIDFMAYMQNTTRKSIHYNDIREIFIKVDNKNQLRDVLLYKGEVSQPKAL